MRAFVYEGEGGSTFSNFSNFCDLFKCIKVIIQKTSIDSITSTFFLRHNIAYNHELTDIIALVDSSTNCSQHTKISCHGMTLSFPDGTIYGALFDRNKKAMEYFGGGPESGKGKGLAQLFSSNVSGEFYTKFRKDITKLANYELRSYE